MIVEIKIEDYISQGEIKYVIIESLKNYVDSNIQNTIKSAIQYAFYDILGKDYLDKLPAIVSEKIKDISVTDIIGFSDDYSLRNNGARDTINQAVRDNKEKLQEIILDKFSKMEDYDAKEILVNALTVK